MDSRILLTVRPGVSTPLDHPLWWSGPDWLKQDQTNWPTQVKLNPNSPADEGTEISLVVIQTVPQPVIPFDRFSKLKPVGSFVLWKIADSRILLRHL